MDNKEKEDNVTLYGENVCTEFVWLPLDKQKELYIYSKVPFYLL